MYGLGPSGGHVLVPPRTWRRMRLKEALRCLLPQTQPPSLRILPARFYVGEAKFRFPVYLTSEKSGTLQTSDVGHWFAIGTTFIADPQGGAEARTQRQWQADPGHRESGGSSVRDVTLGPQSLTRWRQDSCSPGSQRYPEPAGRHRCGCCPGSRSSRRRAG